MDARSYYYDLTEAYCSYGHNRAFHHALWDRDGMDWDAALDRSNELLAEGLGLGPETEILDAGCGIGWFAVWCAKNFGARVTGITVVEKHVGMAYKMAEENGVGHLCRFAVMDMEKLCDVPDRTYDVIINQESFCHAGDKRGYLGQAARILKPGGVWAAIVFSRVDRSFTRPEKRLYEKVLKGFHIPGLWSGEKIEKTLAETGFSNLLIQDISAMTHPTARKMIHHCRAPLLAAKFGLDRFFFRGCPGSRKNHVGHFSAGNAYSKGLLKGCFRHYLIKAQNSTSTLY